MSSFQEILDCRPYSGDGFAYSIKSGSSPYGLDTLIGDADFVDEGKMVCRIPFASGVRRDGVGDILEVGGINLERHRLNALCLFDHGKKVELPIGMAWEFDEVTQKYDTSRYTVHIDPLEKQAYLDCYFYRGKGMVGVSREGEYSHALFSEQLFSMRAQGILRGGSIGYQVQAARELAADYETGTPKGLHLLKVLMLEGSLVVLPANMDTVSKMLTGGKCCGKPLSPYLVKSLSCYAPPRRAQLGWEPGRTGSKSTPIPHGRELEESHTPPAEWKPGVGAVKSLRQKYKMAKRGRPKRTPSQLPGTETPVTVKPIAGKPPRASLTRRRFLAAALAGVIGAEVGAGIGGAIGLNTPKKKPPQKPSKLPALQHGWGDARTFGETGRRAEKLKAGREYTEGGEGPDRIRNDAQLSPEQLDSMSGYHIPDREHLSHGLDQAGWGQHGEQGERKDRVIDYEDYERSYQHGDAPILRSELSGLVRRRSGKSLRLQYGCKSYSPSTSRGRSLLETSPRWGVKLGRGEKSLQWRTLENLRGEPRSFAARAGHGDYRANPHGEGYQVYYFQAGSGKPHPLGKVNSPDDVMGVVHEHHQKLTGDPLRQKRSWSRPQGAKPLRDVGVEKKPTATGITHGEGDVPQTYSRGKKPPLRGQGEAEGPAYGLKSLSRQEVIDLASRKLFGGSAPTTTLTYHNGDAHYGWHIPSDGNVVPREIVHDWFEEQGHTPNYVEVFGSGRIPFHHYVGIEFPPEEEVQGQQGQKSLPLRQKYKKSTGRLRRLKKGIPGRAIIHVPSRSLDAVRKEAHKRGVDLHWGGSTNGIDRIRLTGNQEALEEIGGKYGRTIPPRKSRVGKVEGKGLPRKGKATPSPMPKLNVGDRVTTTTRLCPRPTPTQEVLEIEHPLNTGRDLVLGRGRERTRVYGNERGYRRVGRDPQHQVQRQLTNLRFHVGLGGRDQTGQHVPNSILADKLEDMGLDRHASWVRGLKALRVRRPTPAPTIGNSPGRNQVMAHAIQSRRVKAPAPTKPTTNPAQRNSQPVNPRVGQSSAPQQGVGQMRQGKALRFYGSPFSGRLQARAQHGAYLLQQWGHGKRALRLAYFPAGGEGQPTLELFGNSQSKLEQAANRHHKLRKLPEKGSEEDRQRTHRNTGE